ncbi:unnamed protein product [Cunninghamella echinulata]
MAIWLIISTTITYGQQQQQPIEEIGDGSTEEDPYENYDDSNSNNTNIIDDGTPFDKSTLPKATSAPPGTSDAPFEFTLLDPKILEENKQHIHDYDKGLQRSLWFLKKAASRYVNNPKPFTIHNPNKTDSDPNDYVSLARYFWPNPSTPNGLPYVRRDGAVNPEINNLPDYQTFHDFAKELQFLSLGYYYFNNETYAEKGYQHIYSFFIRPETRMNPHLHYASFIRGYDKGRSKGIIDLSHLPTILDSIAILQSSKAWKSGTNSELRHWFNTYLNWMTTSAHGIEEYEAKNNHGTYYDVQRIALYIFLNEKEKAKTASQEVITKRIITQIRPSGEQAEETLRPFSWYYSTFNLKAFFQLGRLAQKVNVDLFSFQTESRIGIRQALEFLIPSAVDEASWQFNNTGGFKKGSKYLLHILEEAYSVYQDKKYLHIRDTIADDFVDNFNISRLITSWSQFGDHSDSAQRGFGDALDNQATPSIHLHLFLIILSSLFTILYSFF